MKDINKVEEYRNSKEFKKLIPKFEWDTYRSGAMNAKINRCESAIRVRYPKLGIVVDCDKYLSQFKNREAALFEMAEKILKEKT